MTSEYDELLLDLDIPQGSVWDVVSKEAAAAIRALTAQVVGLESSLTTESSSRDSALQRATTAERVATEELLRADAAEAQVVERDAVIEQVEEVARHIGLHIQSEYEEDRGFNALVDDLEAATKQAPRDALAARDAMRDKTVRATALRDAAEAVWPHDELGLARFADDVRWHLRARADQEESSS